MPMASDDCLAEPSFPQRQMLIDDNDVGCLEYVITFKDLEGTSWNSCFYQLLL